MLRAINFMSRAEAQLNDGRAAEALGFERQALRALERAFDRRRYFLRTLPDRSRIDPSRRLTGTLNDARSWTKDPPRTASTVQRDTQRSVMRALAVSVRDHSGAEAALAARVAALDPGSTELQTVAAQLATATTTASHRAAAELAMQAVSAHAQATLASPAEVRLPSDPLSGYLADELRIADGKRVPTVPRVLPGSPKRPSR